MSDFIIAFSGADLASYPFLTAVFGLIIAAFIFFMLASILASLFKINGGR